MCFQELEQQNVGVHHFVLGQTSPKIELPSFSSPQSHHLSPYHPLFSPPPLPKDICFRMHMASQLLLLLLIVLLLEYVNV
jgi:hypothetical protein